MDNGASERGEVERPGAGLAEHLGAITQCRRYFIIWQRADAPSTYTDCPKSALQWMLTVTNQLSGTRRQTRPRAV